jgi:hypothetical protein
MKKRGGTATREPTAVMEVPHQPIGPAINVFELWNEFFAARPGHWSGWEFETYPTVDEIEFLDGARTQAALKVRVGFSGATVLLEKQNGQWKALRLVNHWVT